MSGIAIESGNGGRELLGAPRLRREGLHHGGPPWLQRLRRKAVGTFEALGLPDKKNEEWRETDISPIAGRSFSGDASDLAKWDLARLDSIPLAEIGCDRLVFIDGRLAPQLSSLSGLQGNAWIGNLNGLLSEAPEAVEPYLLRLAAHDRHPFTALNSALFNDGAVIVIPEGVALAKPVQILHVTCGQGGDTSCYPRALVLLRRGAAATLVESFIDGSGNGRHNLTNSVTEIAVEDDARLEHYRVIGKGAVGYHIGRLAIRQGRYSRVKTTNIILGGGLARIDSGALLAGSGAEIDMNGLYMTNGSRHADNHTVLDHAAPHCTSSELYKGILAGESRAVFSGRIVVRPDSQQTDSKQSNPNLLLNEGATIHTRPRLEIEADDVRCTHGATVGHFEPDALFYLRSRGFDEKRAKELLAYGFAKEIIDGVGVPELRRQLEAAVRESIERALAAEEKR
jgi:Fe-S cluster assembly protein SufD